MNIVDWNKLKESGILRRLNEEVCLPNGLQLVIDPATGTSPGAVQMHYATNPSQDVLDDCKIMLQYQSKVVNGNYLLTPHEMRGLIALIKDTVS